MRIQKLIILAFFLITGAVVKAQPPDPGEDPGGAGGGVPIDGGLALLLAAGAGYGAKKAYDYRKKNKKDGEAGSQKD